MDAINAAVPRAVVSVESNKTQRAQGPVEAIPQAPAVSVPQSTPPTGRSEDVDLDQALSRIQQQADQAIAQAGGNARLVIRKDADANRFIYEFVDKKSGEVIDRFPAESLLAGGNAPGGSSAGLVVNKPA